MATPATQQRPNHQRELVFCHQCQDEWYRDEHGIICPACQSEFVEIMENQDSDPRMERMPAFDAGALGINPLAALFQTLTRQASEHPHDHDHHEEHPPNPPQPETGRPRGSTVVHIEGPGFSYSTTRSVGDAGPELIGGLMGTMFRNIIGDAVMPETAPAGDGSRPSTGSGTPPGPQRTERGDRPRATPYAAIFSNGTRLNPRDANTPQANPDQHVLDLPTFLSTVYSGGGYTEMHPNSGYPIPGFLAGLFPPGPRGDYVYSQQDLDRVVSQLMEQHQGNAPPPAPKEVIDKLPRVKVSEQMVFDGTDCAVCKEELIVEEEVCKLPCNHIYHFDCVSKWLEEHDTCPICRHSTTPEDQREAQREAQANEQRQRAAANPLMSWAFGRNAPASENHNTTTTSGPSEGNHAESSGQQSSSNSRSTGGGFAGLFRRRGSN